MQTIQLKVENTKSKHFKAYCAKRPTWRFQLIHRLHATVAWGRSCINYYNARLVAGDVWHGFAFFSMRSVFTSGGGGQSPRVQRLCNTFFFISRLCFFVLYDLLQKQSCCINCLRSFFIFFILPFYRADDVRACMCMLRLSPCTFVGVLQL